MKNEKTKCVLDYLKNPIKLRSAITSILNSKVKDRLEEKRKEIRKRIFKENN